MMNVFWPFEVNWGRFWSSCDVLGHSGQFGRFVTILRLLGVVFLPFWSGLGYYETFIAVLGYFKIVLEVVGYFWAFLVAVGHFQFSKFQLLH